MRSAYLVKPGQIEIRECPTPEPAKGEILVKIASALTCGTDLKAYLRGHDLIPMPGPFGHEFSGTVFETGIGVRKFRESDEIMAVHSAPCLRCAYCARKMYNLCSRIMDSKVLGAFSEYILLPEHVVTQNTYRKPHNLSFDEAAMLEPFSCVVHPYDAIDFREIKTALIIGAGPIGLLHLLFLQSRGVKIFICDSFEKRLQTALECGADISTTPDNLEGTVQEETSGMGVDLVVECTGQPEVWEKSVRYVRRGGIVILFGGCKAGTAVTFDTHRLHYDEISLMGSFHYTPTDVKHAYELLSESKLNVAPLITGRVDLKDIQSAFQGLEKGEGLKYAIHP